MPVLYFPLFIPKMMLAAQFAGELFPTYMYTYTHYPRSRLVRAKIAREIYAFYFDVYFLLAELHPFALSARFSSRTFLFICNMQTRSFTVRQ